MAAVLAKALAQALQGSGLFYESHLADLAFGKRPAQALRAEPQAQVAQARAEAPAGGTSHRTDGGPHTSHPASSGMRQQPQARPADTAATSATPGAAIPHPIVRTSCTERVRQYVSI